MKRYVPAGRLRARRVVVLCAVLALLLFAGCTAAPEPGAPPMVATHTTVSSPKRTVSSERARPSVVPLKITTRIFVHTPGV